MDKELEQIVIEDMKQLLNVIVTEVNKDGYTITVSDLFEKKFITAQEFRSMISGYLFAKGLPITDDHRGIVAAFIS
jgi:transcriptional regulator CtsR